MSMYFYGCTTSHAICFAELVRTSSQVTPFKKKRDLYVYSYIKVIMRQEEIWNSREYAFSIWLILYMWFVLYSSNKFRIARAPRA